MSEVSGIGYYIKWPDGTRVRVKGLPPLKPIPIKKPAPTKKKTSAVKKKTPPSSLYG